MSTQEDKLKQLKTFAAHLLQHIEENKIKQNQTKCAYCQKTEASMTNCKCGYSIFCDACCEVLNLDVGELGEVGEELDAVEVVCMV